MSNQQLNVYIPNSWNDITIKQFTELERLKEKNNNKINRIVEELQILTSLSFEEINCLSLEQINEIYKRMEFLKTEIEYKLVNEFEIFGIKYTAKLEFGKISYNQYVDLIEVLKTKDDNKYKLSEIIACLFVEENKKYGETNKEELIELFYQNLNIVTAYSLTVFFCQISKSFTKVLETYLFKIQIEKMKEMIMMN